MPSRARARALTAVSGLLAFACGRPSYGVEEVRNLDALGGSTCRGYLAADAEEVAHVVLWIPGSGTLSNAALPDALEARIRSGDVAVVTFDKPGISAPFGEPEHAMLNEDVFGTYTLGHLLACARDALRWSDERFGPETRVLLRGHSEGSLISVYLYAALLTAEPELAARVPALVLTGFPAAPLSEVIEGQVERLPEPDREIVSDAIESCDEQVLRNALALSCGYLEDAAERESGFQVFQRLATLQADASFHLFHGTKDENTPVADVEALERWNDAEGGLAMEFRYYDGGHMGTDAARAGVAELLERLTRAGTE
jgi:pimeloyl-ACP methyl ester carboxylesterase